MPSPEDSVEKPIESVLLVGAGWTGRQIAAQCLAHGIAVQLVDQQPTMAIAAREWILTHVQTQVAAQRWPAEAVAWAEHRLEIDPRLPNSTEPQRHAAQADVDLVLECVPESSSAKRKVLKEFSSRFPSPTIIASNSSYFTPSMLSGFVQQPERFAHLHFHAPVWLATIVDIVPGPAASADVGPRLAAFARRIGQTPLVQAIENPGYVFNAILQAMLVASMQLAERGVATPTEIEFAWKQVTGMRVGPFGMMDWIGIDLIQQILHNARWQGDPKATEKLIAFLQPWIEAGALGVKTGQGFFAYPSSSEPT